MQVMGILGKVTILFWNLSEKRLEMWWPCDSSRGRLGTTRL